MVTSALNPQLKKMFSSNNLYKMDPRFCKKNDQQVQ